MEDKKEIITWKNFFFPFCMLMAVLTFIFFAPLISVATSKGEIQCSILELLKLQGLMGTAESLIYFLFGWIVAFILDKYAVKKLLKKFSKENRLAKAKVDEEWKQYKSDKKNKKNKKEDIDDLIIKEE